MEAEQCGFAIVEMVPACCITADMGARWTNTNAATRRQLGLTFGAQ